MSQKVEYNDKSIQVTIEKKLSFQNSDLDKVIDDFLIEEDNDIVYQDNYEKSSKYFSISHFLNEIEEQIIDDEHRKIDKDDIDLVSFSSDSDTFEFFF